MDKANTSLKQLSLKEDLQNQSATNGDDENEQSHIDEEPANTSVDSEIVRLNDIPIESIARYSSFLISNHALLSSYFPILNRKLPIVFKENLNKYLSFRFDSANQQIIDEVFYFLINEIII